MIKAVTQIRRITNTLTLAALLVVSLSMACWSQAVKADDIKLHGAGSSFVAPLIKRWIDEYKVSHRNFAISYDAVGSGEGVKRFLAEEVDFAGSDEILTDSEIGTTRNGAIMVPVTVGMIVVCTENSVRINYVTESPNVSGDDRSVRPLPGLVRLAVQVEEPT
jgi:phosphate transport system substrate-binding protein